MKPRAFRARQIGLHLLQAAVIIVGVLIVIGACQWIASHLPALFRDSGDNWPTERI